ncbi:MAG: choice-of-anchor D domain-containing protein [Actinomycetota bacterium]
MADKNGFWTSTSGVATGLAGTLTGIVGIATLASQMGWIGDDGGGTTPDSTGADAGSSSATTATAAGGDGPSGLGDRTSSSSRAGRSDAAAAPSYTVEPSAVSFQALGGRTATVTLRNTGTVDLDVEEISVDGDDAGQFSVEAPACTSASLGPGRSCTVEVSFTPEGSRAEAVLVVEADGAPAREVALSGPSSLL